MISIPCLTGEKIAEIVGGRLTSKCGKIDSISINTRENFGNNTCFIAINGNNFKGTEFVKDAINKNCKLIIAEEELKVSIPVIIVENTKKALGYIAKHVSKNKKIIGITGSVGKTTVKEMIALVLKEKYKVFNTPKNENNEIGVALSLLSVGNNDYGVIEMGMRGLGQIEWLSYIAEPEISIITNCGTSHLELLGSEENIFAAKAEIMKYTKKYAIVPQEKRFFDYNFGKITPLFIGGNEINYFDLEYNERGICFSVKYGKEIIKDISINSFNINNATNALFAIAAGIICGVDKADIKKALYKYKGENMHEEIIVINGITIINDCYNASYESVRGAIYSLKKYAEINKLTPYLLLGDMLEIGEKSSEYHYRIGELAKDLEIKNIFAIGEYAKNLTDGFLGGIICNTKEELTSLILKNLGKKDVLLIKASRAMKLEMVIEQLKEKRNE